MQPYNILAYGYAEDAPDVARVISSHGDYFHIIGNRGEAVARTKKGAYYAKPDAVKPTTGDFVRVKWNEHGESRILETMPRKSIFERVDPSGRAKRPQTIAVNFDTLFYLTSANLDFSERRLERFLTLARQTGAETVVLITKCDLTDDNGTWFKEIAASYAPNTRIICISAQTGLGMDEVRKYAQPRKTLAFVGSSGVGKSTLVNALAGEEIMPTFEVREWDHKGRHTTTERELVLLPNGAMVIDTPGMREIGIWEAAKGLDEAFPDVVALGGKCRFSDCNHETEPGCAILAAIESGELDQDRFEAYLRLKAENEAAGLPPEKSIRRISSHRYRP